VTDHRSIPLKEARERQRRHEAKRDCRLRVQEHRHEQAKPNGRVGITATRTPDPTDGRRACAILAGLPWLGAIP
jgi:hypothetical protein